MSAGSLSTVVGVRSKVPRAAVPWNQRVPASTYIRWLLVSRKMCAAVLVTYSRLVPGIGANFGSPLTPTNIAGCVATTICGTLFLDSVGSLPVFGLGLPVSRLARPLARAACSAETAPGGSSAMAQGPRSDVALSQPLYTRRYSLPVVSLSSTTRVLRAPCSRVPGS